ncbi:MAG: NAD(P)H-hydrate dehydratase [Aristaeellaceae bacterium]
MDITITPEGMMALEKDYMTSCGISSALLMEHAAQGVCAAIGRRCPGGRALFLCGTGNNGGDGYAAARLWQAVGGRADVLELTDHPRGDALMNRTLALQAGVDVRLAGEDTVLPEGDIIVDALFGTGLARPVEGVALTLIRLARASRRPVIAVDIPSGLSGLTGEVLGEALPAAETVTFHRIKQGLLLGKGPAYTGEITVQPILIPAGYGDQEGLRCMTPDDLSMIPPRPVDGHKGTFGRAVLLAGSPGMAGAAAFAANACVKAGAGLTTVLCRESILPVVQMLAPAAVCIPLPERRGRLTADAAALTADALSTADAAALGCGLGQSDDLVPLLERFARAECPVVWDADALNLLAGRRGLRPGGSAYITPHPGEAARLLGCTVPAVTADPLTALERLGQIAPCALLKGARTLMTDGQHRAVNRYGSPAMAKGGSGDVLTGILAGLLAQHLPATPLGIMQLATLIHGLAGIRAQRIHGEGCATPQALIDCIRLDSQGL